MDVTLSSRLPKDFSQIHMLPSFSKPQSANHPKKLPSLSESVVLRPRQNPRSSKEEFRVQINNKSSNWAEVRVIGASIPARSYHSILYVYGGYDHERGILQDFYRIKVPLDERFSKWERIEASRLENSPGPLCRHGAFVDSEKIYLFGGKTHTLITSNKLHCYDPALNSWLELNPLENCPSPVEVESFTHSFDHKTKEFVIFGGFNSKNAEFKNEMFSLDIGQLKWTKIEYKSYKNPCPRAGHGWGEVGGKFYMFGGEAFEKKLRDFWIFDKSSAIWSEVTSSAGIEEYWPCERSCFSLIPYCSSLILFGGLHNKLFEKNDLYIYSQPKKKWLLCEVESITKQEIELTEVLQKKPREISKILINNNNFSIFSRHIKNSMTLSPLKRSHHSISFEKKEENRRNFLSPEFNERSRNKSAFALGNNTPSKSNFEKNKLGRLTPAAAKDSLTNSMQVSQFLKTPVNRNLDRSTTPRKGLNSAISKAMSPSLPSQVNDSFQRHFKNNSNIILRGSKSMEILKKNLYKPINLSLSSVQQRIFEGRKRILLKQFEVTDEALRKQMLVKNSPTSEQMKHIIYYITKKDIYQNANNQAVNLNKSRLSSVKFNRTIPKIYGKIPGNRPCARDGHGTIVVNQKMIVFGGNRSKIGFNDLYELELDKLFD